ncbi:hypothetical protein BN2475_440065 [Paraburkholderia ribeironis]|uniref:Uncharacterized protein n=1 Tax=Paraburkholderia ribeironis TaxID=1247936 RepID=A0A1N7S8I0_9BURK|nr:hypothetical protein BN2475_440065 [Paraburkholderia ribeironis]
MPLEHCVEESALVLQTGKWSFIEFVAAERISHQYSSFLNFWSARESGRWFVRQRDGREVCREVCNIRTSAKVGLGAAKQAKAGKAARYGQCRLRQNARFVGKTTSRTSESAISENLLKAGFSNRFDDSCADGTKAARDVAARTQSGRCVTR